MADLVDGRYPESNPLWAALGQTVNATQSDIPARTNAEYLGLSTLTDSALAATGVGCFVPIPVDVGIVVSKVSVFVGATAEATGTHLFAAIYSGIATPALIAQSADNTGAAAMAASARFDFTLASANTITSAQAPNGFIYAGIAVTAGTIPTVASVACPTAVGYQWYTTGPLFLAATAGSALGATAAATIASPSARTPAPIVVLT
jgi:hypothetical protein